MENSVEMENSSMCMKFIGFEPFLGLSALQYFYYVCTHIQLQ